MRFAAHTHTHTHTHALTRALSPHATTPTTSCDSEPVVEQLLAAPTRLVAGFVWFSRPAKGWLPRSACGANSLPSPSGRAADARRSSWALAAAGRWPPQPFCRARQRQERTTRHIVVTIVGFGQRTRNGLRFIRRWGGARGATSRHNGRRRAGLFGGGTLCPRWASTASRARAHTHRRSARPSHRSLV